MSSDAHKLKSTAPAHKQNSLSAFAAQLEKEARKLFAQFLYDEKEIKTAASTFIRLVKDLAGKNAGEKESVIVYQNFYEQILRDPRTRKERTSEGKAIALRETITEMREQILDARSSPEARLAHLEIDSYNDARDNILSLYETPGNRTRTEHSSYLNSINQEARDLYERGAAIRGNTLIIPRDAGSITESKEKVRIGSSSHAVEEFAPFVGEEKAKEKAREFVELGKNIAGRTADGDTLMVVFREFYNQIKNDDSGRALSRSKKAERLDVVLERMRELSDAMLKEEWPRDTVEILSLDDWERGIESHQRNSENEYNARLTYRLEEVLEPEFVEEREEMERERINERAEELTRANAALNVSYERIPLNDIPPQLPQNLPQKDKERLRYEIIPQIDRAIESGVRPHAIINSLTIKASNEILKERDAEIARIFLERTPEANQEHAVTRDEKARALYTLQTLGVIGNEVIKEKGFTLRERADAIDVIGTNLAQDYRQLSGRLKTFSEIETERERLNLTAKEYSDVQRTMPEFQTLLKTLREEERVSFLSERNALSQGNDGKLKAEPSSNYSELIGKESNPSLFVIQRQANERIENNLRERLQSLLVNPEIEKAQNSNAERLTEMTNYFSRVTNQEITNSDESRTALAPELKKMRLALNALARERSTIKIERTLGNETLPKPIYVGLPAPNNNLRLAVENLNEYKVIERVASNLSIGIEAYKSRYGEPIFNHSKSHEEQLNFVREYVNYRLLDETTRLKNGNRLFREFGARLNNARSADELRETIKAIRRENYEREKYSERFRVENETMKRNSEQPRKPLSEIELKKLFLSQPPTHYTEEMREMCLNNSLTKREKAERVKGLESGILSPSPTLKTLLSEFDRTQSDNPTQYVRNIKAFLADYMNPPSSGRNRFSRHNLFELRKNLTPAENDYLFKVIDGTKQSVTSGTPTKQLEQDRKERVQVSSVNPALQLKNLRDEIEGRVSSYLISIVQTHGVRALEQRDEGPQHASMVSNIIKETFKENNIRLESLGLTEERIANVSSKLVGELPQVLRERGKQIGSIEVTEIRQLPATLERDSRMFDDNSNKEERVRVATQSAIEPLVNQRAYGNEKERTNEAAHNLNQEQVLSQSLATMVNQPRPQDIAKNHTQKENRYIFSR